ncbi:hypothetical protein DPEC_G00272360 [Dallia pectoralis]|uniref:Uncharacterized protein n=1 Tax=Dallia pectoralis TaxID=75939 RepID=A0ACC2FQ02_DALPE|nr:hypothetical protein DPEC_G00272360 [Dallia pectoralis]
MPKPPKRKMRLMLGGNKGRLGFSKEVGKVEMSKVNMRAGVETVWPTVLPVTKTLFVSYLNWKSVPDVSST